LGGNRKWVEKSLSIGQKPRIWGVSDRGFGQWPVKNPGENNLDIVTDGVTLGVGEQVHIGD
jgi:hypothetical protein